MTKRSLLISVFAAVAIAAPASADWTGFYVGIHAGGVWGDVDWQNVSNASGGDIDFVAPQTISQSADGVLGGAQLGYNFQMTNWLFGVDVSGSGLDFDETTRNTNAGAGNDEFVSSEIEWLVTAAARVGWTWRDSVVFVKGGYATANVNTRHDDSSGGTDGYTGFYATDETHNGWMAGAGLEHEIGEHTSVGLEYNYIDLGNQDHSGITTPGADLVVNDIDVQVHTVTARLNYHFNPF